MIMTVISALEGEDDKAFMVSLYQDYYGLVRKTVYNITHDADNAEDLINDIFIKLIEESVRKVKTLGSHK
ncbi:RNA polymerase sigma factor [Desulfoscipio geothermicus]|uniref:Sigma-70 region 2 n=1 Tax=Desulfoscipio geothermicus DSM 3669 TaxID=1121426 RepID=A0A1I6ELV6_9FIRM|nr:sigma factor [Desulfoscipio geothermicus]SFR18756.1 Sigma-70 region 2 [Desulfoscipio geothermicus DSM 3669]